jgi:hypothetical protein
MPLDESHSGGQIEQGTVINNAARFAFTDDGTLHAVVKYLEWSTADGIECSDVASQHRRQILMHVKTRLDETAEAQHHGKQPDNPRR